MDYISYDPWLTHFCITNKIFNRINRSGDSVVLVNLDKDEEYRKKYNCTFYHALETRSMDRFKQMLFEPISFSNVISNPFAFYGKDVAFKIDIYEEKEIRYPRNIYTDFGFIQNIFKKTPEDKSNGVVANLLIRFFDKGTLLNHISESEIYSLENDIAFEHDSFTFRVIPMLIYVLTTLNEDIMKAYA